MAALVGQNARRPRQFRRIHRQLDDFDDDELRKRYRFGSANLDRLEGLIGDRLTRPTKRNEPLTPRQQIMIALRFYASGSFLQVIGDTFGVDIATVSRAITRVTDALFALKDEFIKFPTSDEDRNVAKRGFYAQRRFPGVIGCIDGTHIRIISPPKAEEVAYVNRKRYHSINVQATCDHLEMAKKGGNWKSELYLVPDAEKNGLVTFTNDNLYEELKKYLKLDEAIEQVSAYKTKLSGVQLTKLILYHMFIVFKTKGCCYSIEKNSEGITLQRSSNEEILLKRSRDGERKPGLDSNSFMKGDNGSKTVGEVIWFIFKENLLNKSYNYLDENCQGFGKDIFNFVARSKSM